MIALSGVSKKFTVPANKNSSLFLNPGTHLRRQSSHRTIWALNNVTLEIKKGQVVGVIGANGSGKSTLLRIIAGIYLPTSGVIRMQAEVTPAVGLKMGFIQDLSVRDNIILFGIALGLERAAIYRLLPRIIEFAGLSAATEVQVKTLSRGGINRLAFSIMMQAYKDIVLFDEVLEGGDEDFRQRCFRVMEDLRKSGRTVLLSSHNIELIERFCDRTLLLDRGSVLAFGGNSEVIARYRAIRRP